VPGGGVVMAAIHRRLLWRYNWRANIENKHNAATDIAY